jgi:ribosomal protein S18 acetylase RimI-like enzyme
MPSAALAATIRPAVLADLAAVSKLGVHLIQLHHGFDPQRFIAAERGAEQGYRSFLKSQLKDPNVIVLVAERDGAVIGYAYAGIEGWDYMALRGPAGILHDIVVAPGQRGQGVGRMLLDAALAALKERGAPRVVLSTAAKNRAAQRLFAEAGFRQTMIEMTREVDES